MSDPQPAFVRGLFAGAIYGDVLFPYPAPLDVRAPDEARVVSRLIRDLRRIQGALIDSAAFDAAETIPEPVIRAFADAGLLALTIPREYGGLGLSSTAYARVFSAISATDASLAVLVGVHCGLGSKATNMAIELYATAAVIGRTQRLIDDRGVGGSERERALCDLFCVTAGRRFRAQRQALAGREDPVDDTRRTIAAAVRTAAGYFVDDPVLEEAPGRP